MIVRGQRWQDLGLKSLIICLLLVGTVFVLLPFVKRSLISYRIASVTITTSQAVPNNESRTIGSTVIQPPTLTEALALYNHVPEGRLGRLVIPDVEIDLSVFPTLVNENLLLGAVSMFPERQPASDNLVLLSHHLWDETLLFGPLRKIALGQRVYLSYGNQFYHYLIEEVKTVDATEVAVMDVRDRGELTLITCDRPTLTNQRLVVKGQLVTETPKEEIEAVFSQIRSVSSETASYQVFLKAFGLIILAVFVMILMIVLVLIKL